MNGPIAQVVALTCYGNAFLSGHPCDRFFPANSTCQFCERVAFVTLGWSFFGRASETEIANSPDAWFALLKSRKALGIRLHHVSHYNPMIVARMLAGFAGGDGAWTMEVLFPDRAGESWIARWGIGNQQAPDRRIWQVTYGRLSRGRTSRPSVCDLKKASHELDETLKEARSFSAKQGMAGFTKCFDEALDTLATRGRNRHGYHKDLAPRGFLSDDAAMLLDACQSAWVFGGMGSWNDLGFQGEDQKTYERVSDRLFDALNAAIVQAATSSAKAGRASSG